MVKDLVLKNRSYRRFYGDYSIERDILLELVNLARLSPSGKNLQPLKYYVSVDKEVNDKVFPTLAWAGYLKEWGGPEESERPTGYIVVLVDKNLTSGTPAIDVGIACQSILLGAIEKGLGGCIVQSVKRPDLMDILNIAPSLEIALVIALGKPKEKVQLVDVANDDIKYYRDEEGTHYVPKRELKDTII